MGRARLRDLGLTIGLMPPGPLNAITDVPGVLVGHRTVIRDAPRVTRTGVTMVVPREGAIWTDYAFAGYHSFNGNGEMTGIPWIEESGLLGTSSRHVEVPGGAYTVGALVQANYGRRHHLRVDGVPVGRELEAGADAVEPRGSIIVIIATDAPLLAVQCRRLAQRATAGL